MDLNEDHQGSHFPIGADVEANGDLSNKLYVNIVVNATN